MALTIELLNAGSVSSESSTSPSRLFPASAPAYTVNKGVLIKCISFQNTSGTANVKLNVQLYPRANTGTTTNKKYIAPVNVSIPPTGEFVLDFEITMSYTPTDYDHIVAWVDSGNAGLIQYSIMGVERDQ